MPVKRKVATSTNMSERPSPKMKSARTGDSRSATGAGAAGGAAPAPTEAAPDIWEAYLSGFLMRGIDEEQASAIPELQEAFNSVREKARAMASSCSSGKLRHNFGSQSAFEGAVRYSSVGHHDPALAQSNFGPEPQRWQNLWLSVVPCSTGPYNGELADRLNTKRQEFIEDLFAFTLAHVERCWESYYDSVRDQSIPGELRASKKKVSPEEFVEAMLVTVRDHERNCAFIDLKFGARGHGDSSGGGYGGASDEPQHEHFEQPPFWLIWSCQAAESMSEQTEACVKDYLAALPGSGAGFEYHISLRANRYCPDAYPFLQKSAGIVSAECLELYMENARKNGTHIKQDCSLNVIPIQSVDKEFLEPLETGVPAKVSLSGARVISGLDQIYTTQGPGPGYLTSVNAGFNAIRVTEEGESTQDASGKSFCFDVDIKKVQSADEPI